MCFPTQRKPSAYFGWQKGVYLELDNVNLEQSIKSKHKIALASVDGTKNINSGEAIHTWVEMDVHRSVMKRKKL